MEIAAEVCFWVGPKATGTARFGREPRRHGACIKGSYPTNPSGTCRSADGPVAVIALANRKGDAVRRSVLASGASEVGTADCIRHVYPAWRSSLQTPTSGSQTLATTLGIATGSAGGAHGIRTRIAQISKLASYLIRPEPVPIYVFCTLACRKHAELQSHAATSALGRSEPLTQ
jgi:hypothetical protein